MLVDIHLILRNRNDMSERLNTPGNKGGKVKHWEAN